MFVDYAEHTVPVVDRESGEVRRAQIFVAVLGASNYTFAEATWTHALPEWVASHVRTFEVVGGCTELLIPDSLRSDVNRAHRYEPDTNPTYHNLTELAVARDAGRSSRLLASLANTEVPVLDAFGLAKLSVETRRDLSSSSRTPMASAPRCSPASPPLSDGTMSWATQPWSTPSSTGSHTVPTRPT